MKHRQRRQALLLSERSTPQSVRIFVFDTSEKCSFQKCSWATAQGHIFLFSYLSYIYVFIWGRNCACVCVCVWKLEHRTFNVEGRQTICRTFWSPFTTRVPETQEIKVEGLKQRLSAFIVLQPFNKDHHVVVVPNNDIISLLLHNSNFSTVKNRNVNICYAEYLICDPPPPKESRTTVWEPMG